MKSVKTWKKFLSVVLSSAIIVTTLAPGAVVSAEENPSVQQGAEVLEFDGTSTDISSEDQTENSSENAPAEQNADDAVTPDEGSNAQDTPDAAAEADDSATVKEQQSESAPAENEAQTKAAADTNLYQDGSICIYNEQQLRAIGNGAQVYEGDASADTFGTGAALAKEDGSALTYAADGTYTLMNDIPLTKGSAWTLPEGFAGAFNDAEVTEDAPLYDAETDTIYVYHQYQLATINDPEAPKTVMSKDMIAKDFGVGQIVYEDADQTVQLEYTDEHNYVVSEDFTEEMPELTAVQVQDESTVQLGGRDYIGQVYKVIDGEPYILIGNEQQLRAIGTDTYVTPLLFKRERKQGGHYEYEPFYPGDADINISRTDQLGTLATDLNMTLTKSTFSNTGSLRNKDDVSKVDGLTGIFDVDYYVVKVEGNGQKSLVVDTDASEYKDLIYTSSNNYIIFRDINLDGTLIDGYGDEDGADWKPLMFSGNMIGAVADASNSIDTIVRQSISGTADASVQATISNITISANKIDVQNTSGVGFFATINSTSNKKIGFSDGAVSVRNLKLQNVSVTNNVEKIEDKRGIINSLLAGLGSLAAWLLGDLGDALKVILNPDANSDDTVFATGAFAGRIQGEVIVENCTVDSINDLTNTYHGMTGGFVGNVEGMTQYGKLQETAGDLVDLLKNLLNIIPVLDLGTLINVLLNGNIINVSKLIPTGYYNPQIINCQVTGNTLAISNDHDFNGGFAGRQVGAIIKNSSVNVNTLSISGKNLAGGFSGVAANAELVGLLDKTGLDLVRSTNLSSYLLNCNVKAGTATITAEGKYAGGLAGSMNNSFSVDSGLNTDGSESTANVSVKAQEYAGGITGNASIAQSISLGSEFYEGKKDLVTLLKNITSEVLAGQEASLLSLTGVSPSYIAGNKINGQLTVVADESYAGGIAGYADGVKIIPSSKLNDEQEGSFIWKQNSDDLNYSPKNQDNSISALGSVKSKEYAGGIIGRSLTASAAGILDKTLGAASYLGFTVDSVTVTGVGDGYTVAAAFENNTGDYAGGAFGQAIGGDVVNVKLDNISSVTAKNYAGGFVGDAGTGSLVNGGGLNLLGLDLVKVTDLLKLAEGVQLNIIDSQVNGNDKNGLSVSATGSNSDGAVEDFAAGGFIGESKSVIAENCTVNNLKSVRADGKAGYAGGFTGTSESGGLADIAENENGLKEIASLSNLLSAADYLIPEYNNCHVTYVTNTAEDGSELPQVQAAVAGGFVGELTGGKVNVTKVEEGKDIPFEVEDKTAVKNIENVKGTYFAGGFAGLATSGGLAETGGLSLLGGKIKLGSVESLISVLEVYMPVINYAGVSAGEKGLVVSASDKMAAESSKDDSKDEEPNADLISSNSGSAGGYVGYGCGVRIADSDVIGLRATDVAAPDPLRSETGESYFGADSKYAVTAPRYAGGYAGKLDIGNAASLGSGLGVDILGIKVTLEGVTDVLAAVASKIENSDVSGKTGGFSVLANEKKENVYTGHAGGYVGMMSGAQITSSNVDQFNYIIGGESAGGYAGTLEPGNVASVLGKADILNGLVSADNLLSALQTFVPFITNSTTAAVPCGGVVRAENGSAGGYAGHSLGGQIKGTDGQEAAIYRIRSVYGQDYAGGFTGLAEAANTADTGNLEILGGIIKLDNPLSVAQAVYAVEENTAVYGPLSHMNVDTWNAWVTGVGAKGPYREEFKEFTDKTFEGDDAQSQLDSFLADYTYGYEVVAPGADKKDGVRENGYAGGYVGKMTGAHITNGQAHDLMDVTAWNSAGGFVGVMTPGSLADLGKIEVAEINITNGLSVLQTFVSVIKQSGVTGYRSGASVEATGYKEKEKAGYAGGFVGNMIGGQIWGETSSCTVTNVNTVTAKNAVGGFAGQILPGSAASVDTSSSNALLDGLLKSIIDTNGDLASVLNATLSTVRNVQITTTNGKGIVVQGAYAVGENTAYAKSAGGFAGTISGAIIGAKDKPNENSDAAASGSETESSKNISLRNLQAVNGGEYAGGFAGKADTSAIAEVSGAGDTSVLDSLLNIGGLDVLDILRPYIFSAEVCGTEDYGFEVKANTAEKLTDINQEAGLYSGSAGGFIGGLLSGTVENSDVDQLRSVEGVNYSGGFVGHTGKSGLVDVDGIEALENILAVGAGVADVIGSDVNSCSVDGIADGFTVKSSGGKSQIVGGFVGYADLGRMKSNTVNNLKQVSSKEIAGGFVGKTSYEYLVNLTGGGVTVDILSKLLDALLEELLKVDKLENGEVIKIDLGIIKVNALWNGKLLSVNLLGIPITASLVEGSTQLKVKIGDSEITLGIDPDDPTIDKDKLENELQVNLIKANRTRIAESTVTGIDIGYDVFGGGASNDQDGSGDLGYAGGFAGFNNEGLLENNKMIKADTIRGTEEKVGEFDGGVSLESVGTDLDDIEKGNTYQVYRLWDDGKLKLLCNKAGKVLGTAQNTKTVIGDTEYYLYDVNHMAADYLMNHDDWKDAYQTPEAASAAQFPVKVYVSSAQADLMLGTPTEENVSDPDKIGETAQDPCAEKATLTIQKLWIDNNDRLDKRPDKVTVQITKDGKEYKSIEMRSKPTDADKNSWTWSETVEIGDLNASKTGYDKVYKYDVNETPVDGYTTIYNWSKDGYTLYIFNYLTSELVQGDSVVIDYGLPVQIDVLANDRINDEAVGGGQLADVATEEQVSAGTISEKEAKGAETATGKFGIATVEKSDDNSTTGNIVYTPTTMQMTSFDKFTYGVRLSGTAVKDVPTYVYGSLSIIPATEIYYEDNFESTDENSVVGIHYVDGSTKTEGSNHGTWRTVGETDDGFQDTDRPGTNELKEAVDNVYGNDTHYTDDTEYSNGSSHVVTVSPENLKSNGGTAPSAWFTFTGTGFDLISMTAFDTGTIRVRIHEGNSLSGQVLDTWTVNTYYGYTYDPNAASDEDKWSLVGSGQDGDQLYQIPIVKSDKLAYGTYTVELLPTYAKNQDVQNKDYYDLYIDAVRIYNPANPADENYSKIEDIYEQDGEVNPQFMELRDLLINASEAEDSSEEAEIANEGIVFIDGKAEDVNLSEYVSYGPKNEVYLAANQAIAFYIEADGKPDTIQLSAKLAMGDSAKLSLACAVQESGDDTAPLKWTKYHANEVEITSAYDLHYSLSEQVQWKETGDGKFITRYPIVVSNISEKDSKSVISLTDLNWTGSSGVDESGEKLPITLMAYTDSSAAEAAYSLVRMSSERTVTVQYQDQDGNQLAEPAVQTVTDGAAYNVSAFIDLQINGYIQKEIQGDPIQGTADADKLITVIYEKEVPKVYTVTVSYVDKEGKALAESYVQENVSEGTIYDLKEQTEKTIDGYEISEITGDAVQGTVSGDVNVTVIYEKEPSVFDNFVDAVVDGFNKVVDGINKVVDWVSNVIASIFPWE